MKTIPLKIEDETLRDGEQQAGVFFSYQTKKELANLIAQVGVDSFAIMPSICESEETLLKTLVADGFRSQAICSTMMGKNYIDRAISYGVERIVLFNALSDRLLFLRDPEIRKMPEFQGKTIDDNIPNAIIDKVRRNAMDKIVEHLRYAKEAGLRIIFGAEDTVRADFDFLVDCVRSFNPYIEHFMLCDTLGMLTPEKSYIWIHNLRECTNDAPLAVHFHNDMGMALENTLQAVMAGASMVSGTFCGIGERAGNVALEQVLNGLRYRFGIEVEGIDYEAIDRVTEYIDRLGVRPPAPYSKATQYNESGIHVNGLLYDPNSYLSFPHQKPEIFFGKCSGSSNFQYLFEKQLQKPLSKERYEKMRSAIKALSIQEERSFTSQEVVALFDRGVFDE